MQKFHYILLGLAAVFIAGCTRFVPGSRQQAFANTFTKVFTLPLKIDSNFIAAPDTLEAMSLSELQVLQNDSVVSDLALGFKNGVAACVFIEKLKVAGRYKGYLDSLDIGMIKNATAYKIGKAFTPDGRYVLLWGINEGSFEADPGYSGVTVFASYPNDADGFTHMVVGQDYFAGDPPVTMRQTTQSEVFENVITITSKTVNEDLDAGSKLSEMQYLKLELDKGKVNTLQSVRSN